MSKTIRKHKDFKHAKLNKQINEVSRGSYEEDAPIRNFRTFDDDGENNNNYRRNYYNNRKNKTKGKIKTKEKELITKKINEYYEDV